MKTKNIYGKHLVLTAIRCSSMLQRRVLFIFFIKDTLCISNFLQSNSMIT